MQTCCPVVELRQYTLHPGMRDVLIKLFDREFVESQEAIVVAEIHHLDAAAVELDDLVEREVEPALAAFVTEPSANTYPRLPVREGENVFVRFSRFPDQAAYALARSATPRLANRVDVLRLAPTARSLLRG